MGHELTSMIALAVLAGARRPADPGELTAALVQRATAGGDAEAQRRVIDALVPVVRARVSLALVRMGGAGRGSLHSDVDDFVQEVLVRLFADGGRRLASWEPSRGAAAAYFGVMAHRMALDLLRVKRTNPYTEMPLDDPDEQEATSAEDTMERLMDREALSMLGRRLRETLSERDRKLFELSVVQGEQDDDVGRQLGLGRDALYQARRRLRLRLAALREELLGGSRSPMAEGAP